MKPTELKKLILDEVTNKIFGAAIDKNKLGLILNNLSNGPGGASFTHLRMNQAGTAAPAGTEYTNTLSDAISPASNAFTYARTSAGIYTVTAPTAVFTASKTVLPNPVLLSVNGAAVGTASFSRTSGTVITISVVNTSNAATDLSSLGGVIDDVKITVYS